MAGEWKNLGMENQVLKARIEELEADLEKKHDAWVVQATSQAQRIEELEAENRRMRWALGRIRRDCKDESIWWAICVANRALEKEDGRTNSNQGV